MGRAREAKAGKPGSLIGQELSYSVARSSTAQLIKRKTHLHKLKPFLPVMIVQKSCQRQRVIRKRNRNRAHRSREKERFRERQMCIVRETERKREREEIMVKEESKSRLHGLERETS